VEGDTCLQASGLVCAGQDSDRQQRLREKAAALLRQTAADGRPAQADADPAHDGAGLQAAGSANATAGEAGDDAAYWAEDIAEGEVVPFQDDGTQDFDHQLAADEQQWEATSIARRLPPGWAKCPNAGAAVFGLTPIKVGCTDCLPCRGHPAS
jgi:hypothetical protein